jgi:hypothetical protein
LTSVLRALAIRSLVFFERGAGAETGTEAGAKAIGAEAGAGVEVGAGVRIKAGTEAKVKAEAVINIKIKAAESILKDGFFLLLSA